MKRKVHQLLDWVSTLARTTAANMLEEVFRQVDEDTLRLRDLLGKASEMAESRFQRRHARTPFQDDGTYTWYGHG